MADGSVLESKASRDRNESALMAGLLTGWSDWLCTLVRSLKPVGTHRKTPESTVRTVLSRNPPDVCREHAFGELRGVARRIPGRGRDEPARKRTDQADQKCDSAGRCRRFREPSPLDCAQPCPTRTLGRVRQNSRQGYPAEIMALHADPSRHYVLDCARILALRRA